MPKVKKAKALSQALAIVCLILNLILPGLGTLIVRSSQEKSLASGIAQLILAIIGWVFCLTIIGIIIGIPLIAAAWIWALVESIGFTREAS